MNARTAEEAILAILAAIPDHNLPEFTVEDDDERRTIWFHHLSMGWVSASDPGRLAANQVAQLLAAEAAGRELLRRAEVTA